MNVTLFTRLPSSETAERLKDALRKERRGIWAGGAKHRVVGWVSGGRFWLRGYIGNPWGMHLFSLGGTLVPTGTGTRIECRYGVYMASGTLAAMGFVSLLLFSLAQVASWSGLHPVLVLGVGLLLFAGPLRFVGPSLMWKVWRPELLAFFADTIDAQVIAEGTRGPI